MENNLLTGILPTSLLVCGKKEHQWLRSLAEMV